MSEPASYADSDLKKFYRESLPPIFWVMAIVLVGSAILIGGVGILSTVRQTAFFDEKQISALGSQGDFFGGHFSAVLGLTTMVFVVASFLLERQRARRSALREAFLRGVDQIMSSRKSPPVDAQYEGVDPISLRLVNYYARVALANPDENELLLILNIAITGNLRTAIEKDAKDRHDYPFASEALAKHRDMETRMHRDKKSLPSLQE